MVVTSIPFQTCMTFHPLPNALPCAAPGHWWLWSVLQVPITFDHLLSHRLYVSAPMGGVMISCFGGVIDLPLYRLVP